MTNKEFWNKFVFIIYVIVKTCLQCFFGLVGIFVLFLCACMLGIIKTKQRDYSLEFSLWKIASYSSLVISRAIWLHTVVVIDLDGMSFGCSTQSSGTNLQVVLLPFFMTISFIGYTMPKLNREFSTPDKATLLLESISNAVQQGTQCRLVKLFFDVRNTSLCFNDQVV